MMTKKGIFYFLYFIYIKIALAQEQQKEFEISEQNIPKTFEILQSLQKTDTNFLATDFGTTAIPIYTEFTRRSVIPTASSYFYYTVTGTFPYSTYPYSKPTDFYETRKQEYSTGFYPFTSSASERYLINETTGSAKKDDLEFDSNYLLPPPPPPLPPNPLPNNIKEILAISLRFSSKEPIIDVVGEFTTADQSTDPPTILQTTKNTFSSTSQVQTIDVTTQNIESTTPMPKLQKTELIGTYIAANSTKIPNLDKNLIRSQIKAVLPENYELTFIQISKEDQNIVNFGMTAILSDEYQSQMPIRILQEIQENQEKIESIQNIEFLGKIIEIREPEITITEISRDQAKNDSSQNSVIKNVDFDVDWVSGILEDNYLFAMIIAICVLFVVILFLSYFVYQKATKTGSVRFR